MSFAALGTDPAADNFFQAYEETKPQYLILDGPRGKDASDRQKLDMYRVT